MFVKAIKKISKAMFPIVFTEQVSPTEAKIGVVGTGFFINSDGYFVSAAHVFDNSTPATKFIFSGYLPDTVQNPPIEIKEIARDDTNDIFIGQINIKTPNFVELSNKPTEIGKTVCVSGYPLANIIADRGIIHLGGVRRYYQPSFVLDYGKINLDNGKGTLRTHDGFLVRDIGLFGMSGGPVFDVEGKVLGMQGSVTNPRESISGDGKRKIIVENALAIRSDLVLEVLKSKNIKIN